ncbi:universal stress protein [Streptomyces sp. NPDC007172]|uniref:universal stress protein n=1 Tax=Streptomyces sp. NPDC007172 TaxID=3364776 RepID=UPI0036D1A257
MAPARATWHLVGGQSAHHAGSGGGGHDAPADPRGPGRIARKRRRRRLGAGEGAAPCLCAWCTPRRARPRGSACCPRGACPTCTRRTHRPKGTEWARAATLDPWREKYPTVPVRARAVEGRPTHHILEGAREAGLLVIGRETHRPATGARLGRVAHAAIHHVRCPVVVVAPNRTTHRGGEVHERPGRLHDRERLHPRDRRAHRRTARRGRGHRRRAACDASGSC